MNYPGIVEYQNIGTLSAGVNPQVRIQSRRIWLDAIMFHFSAVVANTAVSAQVAPNRLLDLVKAIRLTVADPTPRFQTFATGPALVEIAQRRAVSIDPETLWTVGRDVATNTTYRFTVPLFIRPPGVEDPMGAYMGLPLTLSQDPIVEIELRAASDIVTGPAITTSCSMELWLRELSNPNPLYYPTEVLTSTKQWTGGLQSHELNPTGYLTSLLLQNYTAARAARGNALSATTDTWAMMYGTKKVHEQAVLHAGASAVIVGGGYAYPRNPSATADGNWPANSSVFRDFVQDRPDSGAMNYSSALNLNTLAVGGDRFKIQGSNTTNTTETDITTVKVMAQNIDKLIGL